MSSYIVRKNELLNVVLGNIATLKPSRQSSTYSSKFGAEKANDGNRDRDLAGGESCSHTAAGQTIAWWQVNLQNSFVVTGINITTRQNHGQYNDVNFICLFNVINHLRWLLLLFPLRRVPVLLSPVHTREPMNPRSLPLWQNGRIGHERTLNGKCVYWYKIQRGLVGFALRGRGERDKFFNRLKNGRGWSRSL